MFGFICIDMIALFWLMISESSKGSCRYVAVPLTYEIESGGIRVECWWSLLSDSEWSRLRSIGTSRFWTRCAGAEIWAPLREMDTNSTESGIIPTYILLLTYGINAIRYMKHFTSRDTYTVILSASIILRLKDIRCIGVDITTRYRRNESLTRLIFC